MRLSPPVLVGNPIRLSNGRNWATLTPDGRRSHTAVDCTNQLISLRGRLKAEILVLRQQINVLRRDSPKRFDFRTFDRLVFVGLYRLAPGILDALAIVRPETVVRWTVLDFDHSGVGNPGGAAGDRASRWRSVS